MSSYAALGLDALAIATSTINYLRTEHVGIVNVLRLRVVGALTWIANLM